MSIEIKGLNHRQRALADVLWLMNSKEDCQRFIASLHPTMRKEAEVVVEMMILAVIDEVDSVAESQQLLTRFQLPK
jgi:hypothetical protein